MKFRIILALIIVYCIRSILNTFLMAEENSNICSFCNLAFPVLHSKLDFDVDKSWAKTDINEFGDLSAFEVQISLYYSLKNLTYLGIVTSYLNTITSIDEDSDGSITVDVVNSGLSLLHFFNSFEYPGLYIRVDIYPYSHIEVDNRKLDDTIKENCIGFLIGGGYYWKCFKNNNLMFGIHFQNEYLYEKNLKASYFMMGLSLLEKF